MREESECYMCKELVKYDIPLEITAEQKARGMIGAAKCKCKCGHEMATFSYSKESALAKNVGTLMKELKKEPNKTLVVESEEDNGHLH
jgi:hypothetical protein